MTDPCLSDRFSLRWNNFSNNLSSGFLSHLSEHDLVDVTLAVEGHLVQAHKLVLSVCSPYFKNIFKENPCQHPVIILKDIKYEEVESLLKFMYQGEISIKQEDLSTFLKVAQTLQIKGLANEIAFSESETATPPQGSISEHGNETDPPEQQVESREIPKRNLKRKKDTAAPENCEDSSKISGTLVEEEAALLSNEESHQPWETDNTRSFSDFSSPDVSNEGPCEKNNEEAAIEPVTYRLSARGKPQLVHEGYVYNLTSRSEGLNRSHYRCAEQHRGCKGKCAVIAERFMPTGVRDHNHPPGYHSEYNYRKRKGLDPESS